MGRTSGMHGMHDHGAGGQPVAVVQWWGIWRISRGVARGKTPPSRCDNDEAVMSRTMRRSNVTNHQLTQHDCAQDIGTKSVQQTRGDPTTILESRGSAN